MSEREASDLRLLIERRVQCELKVQQAAQELREANYQFEQWVYKQQHPTVN